jgi:hypothetical protein
VKITFNDLQIVETYFRRYETGEEIGECRACEGVSEVQCSCRDCGDDHPRECQDCKGTGIDHPSPQLFRDVPNVVVVKFAIVAPRPHRERRIVYDYRCEAIAGLETLKVTGDEFVDFAFKREPNRVIL